MKRQQQLNMIPSSIVHYEYMILAKTISVLRGAVLLLFEPVDDSKTGHVKTWLE